MSTFGDYSFHDFLGHVEQFRIEISGKGVFYKDYEGQPEEYVAFMGKLDDDFFNDLGKFNTLYIDATEAGRLGLKGIDQAPLAFHSGQMPLPKTLDLGNIFICTELTDFLNCHKDILEEVMLHGCYAFPRATPKTASIGPNSSLASPPLSTPNSVDSDLKVRYAISLPSHEDLIGGRVGRRAHWLGCNCVRE